MIHFNLNGKPVSYKGNQETRLLHLLRNEKGITSVKDGCSCQGACGACLVEINGEAKLSCMTTIGKLDNAVINTLEGIPDNIRDVLAKAFVDKGAVQCGFCTPGFLMRTKILLQKNPQPSRDDIKKALTLNLCRCTGYVKIVDAIADAANRLHAEHTSEIKAVSGKVGASYPKYEAYEMAVGKRKFVNDLQFEGMLYGALRFTDHPRAMIREINISKALQVKGVIRIFTSGDVPGDRYVGLIFKDWPLMIGPGETTRYIGDVLAGVVAETDETARKAAALIEVTYEVLDPVIDPHEAIKADSPKVHPDRENLLETCRVYRGGDAEQVLNGSDFVAKGIYRTQRIEHAFLETEGAVAMPDGDGVHLYSNGQGIYVDRRQVASLLGIPEEKVRVTLVSTGGGFGGKEDMTVQGHASLFARVLKQPVKVVLNREESIRMHPKRHPVYMDIAVGCDKNGKLTGLKLYAVGDSGAYASVGTKVMERVAGHATGAYHFPCVNLEALTVYTNNIPSGAMRGFGANQVCFALEGCIDDLCDQGGFDRWQFRYENALTEGRMTATGQVLKGGVGVRATLEAVKPYYDKSRIKGLACGIKNSGVGNGMADYSDVIISIISENKVHLQHGWTEMGQGVHTIAQQVLFEETGIHPEFVEVTVDSSAGIPTGMTTSSRATALLGNAILDASKKIREDLKSHSLKELSGKTYKGNYSYDLTTKPGAEVKEIITHFAYGYATQLVVLNDSGEIETVYAAHDAGKIMNPVMFEGQIEGAVHMGLGYALSEDLPMVDGQLVSSKMRDLKILRAKDMPEIVVLGVEVKDPVGPYGAKGLGEIGLVPTAAAVANAIWAFDGIRRYKLPIDRER
ncbi:MAG: selenium-dependent molybdenum hydroxylase 1 [Bacteroidetes bacterium]|nr:MAG: selenium-dependent molybdenum hydroxylase 1 [Bacteroidota bacterium]